MLVERVVEEGMWISREGSENRAERARAVSEEGGALGRDFFVGRFERGSADVGIDSGICSDIVCCVFEWVEL